MTQRFDFFWYDSKNRTLFWIRLKELIFFFKKKTWFKELNLLHKRTPIIDFFTIFSKIWTLFNMTHRIEPFLNNMTHWDWTLLFNMSQRKWLIFCMTQRFSSFLQNVWLKEWIDRSWKIWLWELKFLKEKRTLRIEPFQKLTRWIEPSVLHDPKNWTFFSYITQRIGLSSFLNPFSTIALNDWPCFEHDSQNWTFLFKMTQRIEHMTWLKVLIEFF